MHFWHYQHFNHCPTLFQMFKFFIFDFGFLLAEFVELQINHSSTEKRQFFVFFGV